MGQAVIDRITRVIADIGDEDFARTPPPADLWGRISASLDHEVAGGSVTTAGEAPPGDDVDLIAPVTSLDEHRRRRLRGVLIAVAAAVVVLAGVGLLLARGGSSPDEQLVASTSLEPLEPISATAAARLVRHDGDLELILDAHDMTAAPSGQHYELWLLDPAAGEPVSLGPMTGSTTVTVPAGVDPSEYDVVDVSLQHTGETQHSGHSLLRGTLA